MRPLFLFAVKRLRAVVLEHPTSMLINILFLCSRVEPRVISAKLLGRRGIRPFFVSTVAAAKHFLEETSVDALVLIAPDRPVIVDLRASIYELVLLRIPLFLFATELTDIVQAKLLEAGITDILWKESSDSLISLRLKRMLELRVSPAAISHSLTVGGLRLDSTNVRASYQGKKVQVTGKQFWLLFLLAQNLNNDVHRHEIVNALQIRDGSRNIDMLVKRVRTLLEKSDITGLRVETSYGLGYRMTLAGE